MRILLKTLNDQLQRVAMTLEKRMAQVVLAIIVAMIGIFVLIGYFAHMPSFLSPVDAIIGGPMSNAGVSPTTAVCLILLAVSIILSSLKGTK